MEYDTSPLQNCAPPPKKKPTRGGSYQVFVIGMVSFQNLEKNLVKLHYLFYLKIVLFVKNLLNHINILKISFYISLFLEFLV